MAQIPDVIGQADAPVPSTGVLLTIAYVALATVAGWAYVQADPTAFAGLATGPLRWLLVGFAVMGTAFVATAAAAVIGELYLAVRRVG